MSPLPRHVRQQNAPYAVRADSLLLASLLGGTCRNKLAHVSHLAGADDAQIGAVAKEYVRNVSIAKTRGNHQRRRSVHARVERAARVGVIA